MIKRALLVGLNMYPDPRSELRGCVNDIIDMAKLLTDDYGFVDPKCVPGQKDREMLQFIRA